jgi:hypothetical protein
VTELHTIDPAVLRIIEQSLAAQGTPVIDAMLADTSEDGLAIKFRESLGERIHFDPSAGWVIFRPGSHVWQLSQRGAAVSEAVSTRRRESVVGECP